MVASEVYEARREALLALPPEADRLIVDILEMGWFSPEYHYHRIAEETIAALLLRGSLPDHVRQRLDTLVEKVFAEKESNIQDESVAMEWIASHWKFDPAKGEQLVWKFMDAGRTGIWLRTYQKLAKTGNAETISRLQELAQYVSKRWPGAHEVTEIQQTIDAIETRLAAEKPAFDGLRPPAPQSAPASSGGLAAGGTANGGADTAKPDTTGWLFAALLAGISLAALLLFRAAYRRR